MKGLIILAHGSKVKSTNEMLEKILAELTKKVEYDHVEGAYLQLMDPSLDMAIDIMDKKEITDITVFPMFLFKGNHIREDIPEEIEKILAVKPHLNIKFLENIGYDEKLVEIIAERVSL